MPEGTRISKHSVCAYYPCVLWSLTTSAIPISSWLKMKPLFDLLLKSKFIPLSCRTKSVMYLTETIPHTSNLTAEQSCQHKKKNKPQPNTPKPTTTTKIPSKNYKKQHSKQHGFGDRSCVISCLAQFIYFCKQAFKYSLDTIYTHICLPLPCCSQLLIKLNWIWPLPWMQANVNSNLMLDTLTEAGLLFYMHLCQVRKLSEYHLTNSKVEGTKLH